MGETFPGVLAPNLPHDKIPDVFPGDESRLEGILHGEFPNEGNFFLDPGNTFLEAILFQFLPQSFIFASKKPYFLLLELMF